MQKIADQQYERYVGWPTRLPLVSNCQIRFAILRAVATFAVLDPEKEGTRRLLMVGTSAQNSILRLAPTFFPLPFAG
ncbi:hypothetical protein KHC17_27550 (plasmid) [Agrobacterium salinitolerans]|uniref:hypothetical protein n=1 Tax=Agrobacterium salinitolerans TaxID=1183413 RepID=UPI001C229E57|nr:hypothetical protein [Agrobacterium salinitolerans]QXC52883.1 hypothetical protein KHC17_27550 [Agrobacterium salinitolerans]